MSHAYTLPHGATVGALITTGTACLTQAGVGFGHGTANAEEEAIWLVLWQLGLPIDAPLGDEEDSVENQPVTPEQQAQVATLFKERIDTRKPAAYLTHEAWLMGVPFYVDERSIVPRSFIAELLADGSIDHFLSDKTKHVLDLCTGNGSLACLAAMAYPEVQVTGADLSTDALAVARINVDKHGLQERVTLVETDGLSKVPGPWDLILCNPPYVNADSMAIYAEWVPFDGALAQRLSDRAVNIIAATEAGELLPRGFTDSTHVECRFCSWQDRCWGMR